MKQEEIIEMAGQAGIPFNKWGMIGCEDCEQDIDQNLVAFAKLVAAKEREACAKVLDDMAEQMIADMEPSTAIAWVRNRAEFIRARGEA